jgi:hypothetical protein
MLTREFRSTLFSGVKIEVIKAPFRNKNSKMTIRKVQIGQQIEREEKIITSTKVDTSSKLFHSSHPPLNSRSNSIQQDQKKKSLDQRKLGGLEFCTLIVIWRVA